MPLGCSSCHQPGPAGHIHRIRASQPRPGSAHGCTLPAGGGLRPRRASNVPFVQAQPEAHRGVQCLQEHAEESRHSSGTLSLPPRARQRKADLSSGRNRHLAQRELLGQLTFAGKLSPF